nr:phosphatase PAP2 family protein [Streptomyces sp. MST-110588]
MSALLFTVLAWQVVSHGPLRTLDEHLGRTLATSTPLTRLLPTSLAGLFADLGNTAVALPVLALCAAYTAYAAHTARPPRPSEPEQANTPHDRRWWLPPLAALATMAAVPALVVPLKVWLARPGPPPMVATGAPDNFFPSGHAATAAIAYGAAALLLAWRHPRARRPLAAAAVLLNLAVGIGLVRHGYHWPLDVTASWCLAGILLPAFSAARARWSPPSRWSPPPR